MNLWLTPPLRYPEKPIDRGKVLGADDLGVGEVVGTLSRRRQRRQSATARSPAPSTPSRLLHPRHRPRREGALQREARGLEEEPRPPRPQARDRAEACVPAPVVDEEKGAQGRPIAYGSTHGPSSRPATSSATQGIESNYCASARCPISDEVATSSSGTSGSTSSSRTATASSAAILRRSCRPP